MNNSTQLVHASSKSNNENLINTSTKDGELWITTIDNPFNPFTQNDLWMSYDMQKGYNTMSLAARIVNLSDALSIEEQEKIIDDAFREIAYYNLSGVHILVTPKSYKGSDWFTRAQKLQSKKTS